MGDRAALAERFEVLMGQAEEIRMPYDGKPESMTPEEEVKFDKILDDADKVKAQIDRIDKEATLTKWAEGGSGTPDPHLHDGADPPDGDDNDAAKKQAKHLRGVFTKFLQGGSTALTNDEVKALQADVPVSGGYLVAPMQFVQELLKGVDDQVFIRQFARKFELTKAESLGVPTLDTDISDADWTTELATGSLDTDLAFGRRQLSPNPLAKRVKVSNKLLRQAMLDPAAIIRERLAYKFGVTEEKAFLTGNGASQPLGVFTAHTDGIPTGQDTLAASATAIAGDDFINCKHALKAQYWNQGVWVMHRDIILLVRKLKDSNNNYLWASGLGPGLGLQGNPATLLDRPYYLSEYAPNTVTASLYVAIFADFRFYWIVDALDMQVQVLSELYAETNQIGYIARRELDGMPVLSEAFRRLKMAAS